MFERPHLHLSDQLFPLLGLIVELRKDVLEEVPDEAGLVVGSAVEGNQSDSPHVKVRVLKSGKEMADLRLEELVDGLWLVRDGELHGGDHGGPHEGGGGAEAHLEFGKERLRGHETELAQTLGDNIPEENSE